MIKPLEMQIFVAGKDVTDYTGEITISGSLEQVSRQMDIQFIRPDVDYYLGGVNCKLGDTVTVYMRGTPIYTGVIWFKGFDGESADQKVTCYDIAIYTSKSHIANSVFNNCSCSDIAGRVLGELGLPVGKLEPGIVKSYNGRDKTGYEIIKGAYEEAEKATGNRYHMVVDGGVVNVLKRGELIPTVCQYLEQHLPGGIIGLSFEENIDNMINKVRSIDEKDRDDKKDGAMNVGDIATYGLVQKLVSGKVEETEGVLTSARSEIDLECFGDVAMKSGYSINVNTEKVNGVYHIIEDSHTFKDKQIHTAKLKLAKE